jgi:aminoglycoside phosphotransferase (APT) family kinase protein
MNGPALSTPRPRHEPTEQHDNRHVLDLSRVQRMQAATGGAATSVWRVDSGRRVYALRVFRADQASALQRELNALGAAEAAAIPVPRVHAVGTYDERPALLLEWCAGRSLVSTLEAQPWQVFQLGRAFGRLQAAVHVVRAPGGLRSGWVDWPAPAEPALAACLRSMQPRTDRLLHLDYHPLNVLAERGRLTAVLDWTNAHAGDPRADVARTVSILRLMPRIERLAPLRRVAFLGFELAWRSGYGPLGQNLAPFYAWAGAAMLRDLAGRYTESQLEPARRWAEAWMRRSGLA